jgi:hypothetical protein
MSEPGGDLRPEVARLRRDVDRLEAESADTRRLASLADRDVGDVRLALRSQTLLLNALRDTQREHGLTLIEHGEKLGGLTLQVDGLDKKVDALDKKVDALAEGQAEHSQILAEILHRLPRPGNVSP